MILIPKYKKITELYDNVNAIVSFPADYLRH